MTKVDVLQRNIDLYQGISKFFEVDNEDVSYINGRIEEKILEKFTKNIKDSNVVVISDYQKGLLTKKLIDKFIKVCNQKGKTIIVDPKNIDLGYYKNSQLSLRIKKNYWEKMKRL